MNIEVFSLCDAATDNAGKLNVLGTFDTIFAQELPTLHPQCAVALRLRLQPPECCEHKLELHIVDEDGRHVIPALKAAFNVQIGQDQPSATTNLVLNMQRVKFDKEGEYSIDLAIDGRHEGTLPLYVRKVQAVAKAA